MQSYAFSLAFCCIPANFNVSALLFFLPIGALCPIILYQITRHYPKSILNYIKLACFPVHRFHPLLTFDHPSASRTLPFCLTGLVDVIHELSDLRLMFSGLDDIPPACAVNYVPWTILGFIFQYIIRRRHFTFWAKYNYVLSAALDTGTAVGMLFVFFW